MVSLTGLQSVIYLLYILSIGYSSGILQYSCEPGEINEVNIIIERTVNNLTDFNIADNISCTKAGNDSHVRLTACPVNTDITVTFAKPENDSLVRKVDVHSYILNCRRDDKPVTKVVALPITVKPPSASAQTPNTFGRTDWIPTLSMTVSKPDVVIGETVELIISSTKDTNSTISALKCTASSASPNHIHVLWQSEDCNLVDSQLFGDENWTTNGTKQISHSFEAFRFEDNHNVQITCTVRICPKGKESSCPLACTHKGARRRRRAAQSETTKVLKTTFRVSDYLQHQNTNSGTKSGTNSGTCKGSFLATSAISAVILFYTVLL